MNFHPLFLAILTAAAIAGAGETGKSEPVFFPPLPESPHYQWLRSYSTAEEFGEKDGWLSKLLFGKANEDEGLGKPYGIGAYDGKIYLCDAGSGDVRILDLSGKKTGWLAKSQKVSLLKPINITIDQQTGYKFVSDAALKKVVVFDKRDKFVRAFEDPAGWAPTDAVIYGPELFVVDVQNHRVKVLDVKTGKILRAVGEPGSGDGQLFKPTNIAIGPGGLLYVSDTINFRVQVFSRNGLFKRSIGKLGRRPGDFARPKGVAVDRDNRLYVVDAGFDNVQVFNPERKPLIFLGGTGNDPGQMYLPAKVLVDYGVKTRDALSKYVDPRLRLEYLVWVTNQYGPQRLMVFGYGEWTDAEISP